MSKHKWISKKGLRYRPGRHKHSVNSAGESILPVPNELPDIEYDDLPENVRNAVSELLRKRGLKASPLAESAESTLTGSM